MARYELSARGKKWDEAEEVEREPARQKATVLLEELARKYGVYKAAVVCSIPDQEVRNALTSGRPIDILAPTTPSIASKTLEQIGIRELSALLREKWKKNESWGSRRGRRALDDTDGVTPMAIFRISTKLARWAEQLMMAFDPRMKDKARRLNRDKFHAVRNAVRVFRKAARVLDAWLEEP